MTLTTLITRRIPRCASTVRLAALLAVAILAAGLSGCASRKPHADNATAEAKPAQRPNILFIFTDDHGVQAISTYGSKINRTPQIDRLADSGMRFDNCFCTNAICAPSRAVILTGKHSHINGQVSNHERFDGSQSTFPKMLRQAGYQTALIGKWHLKSDPTGFDHWEVLIDQGPYYNPPMIRNGEKVQYTGYTTDIITDRALEWMQQRDPEKPFLLMCQHKAPHRDWKPDARHLTMYDDVTIPEPPTLFDDWSGRSRASTMQEMTIAEHMSPGDLKLTTPRRLNAEQLAPWNAAYGPKNEAFREANLTGKDLVRWKYQRYAKDYLRCVASVDDNIGRLLDYLEQSGLADNTVVVYSSDQGWFLGEHGWFDKRWMYEESLRMPFIVRWPGKTKPGSVNTDLVQNLDFAPTFLAMAGADVPGDMQGRSAAPLLAGETPDDWRDAVYYHFYADWAWHTVPRHYGVRTDRYKLIHFYRIDEWELYDLVKDPDEMHNLYDDPAYASTVIRLKAVLQRLRQQYRESDVADQACDRIAERRARNR